MTKLIALHSVELCVTPGTSTQSDTGEIKVTKMARTRTVKPGTIFETPDSGTADNLSDTEKDLIRLRAARVATEEEIAMAEFRAQRKAAAGAPGELTGEAARRGAPVSTDLASAPAGAGGDDADAKAAADAEAAAKEAAAKDAAAKEAAAKEAAAKGGKSNRKVI